MTLAQHRLPVVVAVHHDGRIGMIEYMQTAAGRAPYATEIGDVARYAEGGRIPARRVDDPAELGAAWDEALGAGGPFLIELMAGHAFPRPSLPRLVEQGCADERVERIRGADDAAHGSLAPACAAGGAGRGTGGPR